MLIGLGFRPLLAAGVALIGNTAPGVGLGLALCRRLSRSMGGDLKFAPGVKGGALIIVGEVVLEAGGPPARATIGPACSPSSSRAVSQCRLLSPSRSACHPASLTEAFFTKLKVAVIAGIFLASPIVFFQVWRFVAPGLYERERRVVRMVQAMDEAGFGNCTVTGSCEAVCPKSISLDFIARLNRDYAVALLKGDPKPVSSGGA